MSNGPPTYSFLPWLRIGVANNIAQADGDPGVHVRATLPVDLTLSVTKLDGTVDNQNLPPRDVNLYGPGDVIGVESRAVIKVEPHNWITNFEPNYLPYVEFYDEDFPWRYVPAAADVPRHHLRPWIALVVLKESEFRDGTDVQGKPLPYFDLAAGLDPVDLFPPADQLWAWAHVHVNTDLSANGDMSIPGVLQRFQSLIGSNPDLGYSRIVCPRHLEPDVDYHAFLVPTFETGRLAGLGRPVPDATVATASAWDNHQTQFPYYYRWQFRTGDFGDFEYLVKLLKPHPADKRVGVRDMDVLHPGSNLPKIDVPAELHGVLKLGGALRVPLGTLPKDDRQEVEKYDKWDEPFPHPFEVAMAARINLADDYSRAAASSVNPDNDPDPVVTSPLYGRWPALVDRLLRAADGSDLSDRQNWIHRLNLDPRYRVPAGFGTEVVQGNDEQYMNAAWQQVGDVLSANNRIRLAQLAQAASLSWHSRNVEALPVERAFLLTAPLHSRVLIERRDALAASSARGAAAPAGAATVASFVQASVVPPVVASAPFRRVTRAGTALSSRLALPPAVSAEVVARINTGELHPAPPKVPPTGGITVGDAGKAVEPQAEPPFVRKLLERYPWLRFVPLLLLLALVVLAIVLGGAWLIALGPAGAALLAVFALLMRWTRNDALARSIDEERQTPASVDTLPTVPNFVLSRPDSGFTPSSGATDSPEATRFKAALRDAYTFTSVDFPQPVKARLDLAALTRATVAAIHPAKTIPARVLGTLVLPPWLLAGLVDEERFVPAMAYPVFDVPMYKPLSDLSSELFLPHINLIPPNSLTLLETNQAFIESYMVGLNHEMARELLWREYPTDQRGSYFRQFWDVSLVLPPNPTAADREHFRDIPELHLWSRHSALGTHDQRAEHGEAALLVLVVRGELLKRYPTTVIYAQKAEWGTNEHGQPDASEERELVDLDPAEEDSLPPEKIRKPLFEAKVDPDIYFIGFDLTDVEARGGTTVEEDAGWFFVLKERPGEPRFGLDDVPAGETQRLINWNDLAWQHLGTAAGAVIHLDKTLHFDVYDHDLDQEDKPDPEDAQASWNPGTNAAELAYMLYRVPVLVAYHASKMLPPPPPP